MIGTQLHNVAVHVRRGDFDDMRAFCTDRVVLPIVFEEPGHICCFGVGQYRAICVHGAEAGHPGGTREFFLWVDEPSVEPLAEVRLTDPLGNQLRLHKRSGGA